MYNFIFVKLYKNLKVRNILLQVIYNRIKNIELLYQNYFIYIYMILAIDFGNFVPDQKVISILNTRENIYKKKFVFLSVYFYLFYNISENYKKLLLCVFFC